MHTTDAVALVDSASGGRLRLLFPVNEACARCGACRLWEGPDHRLEIEDTLGVRPGDRVLVRIGISRLRISLLLFGFPCAAFLAGLSAGVCCLHSETAGLVLGAAGTALYALSARSFFGRIRPALVRRMEGDPSGGSFAWKSRKEEES